MATAALILVASTAATAGPLPGTAAAAAGTSAAAGHAAQRRAPPTFVFSPYKDVTLDLAADSALMRTGVTGKAIPLVGADGLAPGALPALKTITLAFANGECGRETWGALSGPVFAEANIRRLDEARVGYIIATGGQGQTFTCPTPDGMLAFIARYASPRMVGVDFDIEHDQSPAVVAALVAGVKRAETAYPQLRFSFTLATWAGTDASRKGLNPLASRVVATIVKAGLRHYTINLMTMDYGHVGADVCVVADDHCDMGRSAIQAAENFFRAYPSIPPDHVELTPMIGANDDAHQVFTLRDADVMARYVIHRGLGGVHFWSLDRDRPCARGKTPHFCNSRADVTPLAYTRRFLEDLGE